MHLAVITLTTYCYILYRVFASSVAVGIYFSIWSYLHSSGILRSVQ